MLVEGTAFRVSESRVFRKAFVPSSRSEIQRERMESYGICRLINLQVQYFLLESGQKQKPQHLANAESTKFV